MTRAVALLLASMTLGAGSETETPEASRWRHNSRARTEAGLEQQQDGDLQEAVGAFAEALGLSPDDPLVRFNAGTASLLGGGPAAIELLESATESAPPELQALAYYNLGNAHMAAQDVPAAIDSFKQSLRLDPQNVDVKHNLELAQQMQDQQQQEQEQEQDESEEQQQQQQEQQQEGEQGPEEEQQNEQGEQDQSQSPLPDFEDQPDMTAEQAAAILEAVENLEREQRRKQALEQLKRAKGDRDW